MLLDQHGIIIMEAILMEKKKRHHTCHLSFSMSNSDYSLCCGSMVTQLIYNLVVGLCVCWGGSTVMSQKQIRKQVWCVAAFPSLPFIYISITYKQKCIFFFLPSKQSNYHWLRGDEANDLSVVTPSEAAFHRLRLSGRWCVFCYLIVDG